MKTAPFAANAGTGHRFAPWNTKIADGVLDLPVSPFLQGSLDLTQQREAGGVPFWEYTFTTLEAEVGIDRRGKAYLASPHRLVDSASLVRVLSGKSAFAEFLYLVSA